MAELERFNNGEILHASQLNSVVDEIEEVSDMVGGVSQTDELERFSSGEILTAGKLNLMVEKIESIKDAVGDANAILEKLLTTGVDDE